MAISKFDAKVRVVTIPQRLMRWASDVHLAKLEVERLHKERGDLECEFEQPRGNEPYPCWKWVHDAELDDYGRSRADFWCNMSGKFCDTCEKRNRVNAKYQAANRRLRSLKGAMWKLAAKAHAEVERELDEAGK